MDKTYRLENFSPTDAEGIRRRLEHMAARGLHLESIGSFLWCYRKEAPAARTYAVTYLPAAAQGRALEDYEALCAAAGWRWVAHWGLMQILCAEQPEPVPPETDESVKLQAIRTSLRQQFLPGYLALLASRQWTVRNVDTGVQSCVYAVHDPAFPWVQDLCLRQLSQEAADAFEVVVPGAEGALVWTQDGADCGLLWSDDAIVVYRFQEPPSAGELPELMAEALQ